MNIDRIIGVVIGLGLVTLFFFPEPETNFAWYVLAGVLFALAVGVLFWVRKRK